MSSLRKLAFKVLLLALVVPILTAAPSSANNCSAVQNTFISDFGQLWGLRWNALSDTTNVYSLNIFAQSTDGNQSWHNNVSGYYWGTAAIDGNTFLINKNGLVWFMNERDITSIRFVIRKDNAVSNCYPESIFGTITPPQLIAATALTFSDITVDSVRLSFTTNYGWANQIVTLSPTGGGATITVNNFISGSIISGLQPETEYQVRVKTMGGLAGTNNTSAISTFRTSSPLRIIPTYTVSYLGSGSDVSSIPSDVNRYYGDQSTSIAPRSPLRTGYSFTGWNTSSDGKGRTYQAGDVIELNDSDVTLYAQWKINSYSISFDSNGGPALDSPTLTGQFASNIEIPNLSGKAMRKGFTFLGWNSSLDGSGSTYAPGESYRFPSNNATLYAQWKVNSYTVSYNGNGHEIGRIPASVSNDFGSTLIVESPSPRFIRKGFSFKGWNTKQDGTGVTFAIGDKFTIGAENQILYALWIPNEYQVKYLNSSSYSIENGSFRTNGNVINTPTPAERPGFVFKGWSVSPFRNSVISIPYYPGVMRNVSLYAVWEKKA